MTACATSETIANQPSNCNLFLPVPDTDFRDFLDEVADLLRFAPEIITAIERDLDAHALAKKKLRLEDRKFFESRTAEFPGLEMPGVSTILDNLNVISQKTREFIFDRRRHGAGPSPDRAIARGGGGRQALHGTPAGAVVDANSRRQCR